jgi:hypothetical protein
MNDELERIWKEEMAALYSYSTSIDLEGLRKTMDTLSG